MMKIIKLTIKAVKRKLNPLNRDQCFEILGYDFMIDKDYNIMLLEINTNPCLALSSPLLEKMIP